MVESLGSLKVFGEYVVQRSFCPQKGCAPCAQGSVHPEGYQALGEGRKMTSDHC